MKVSKELMQERSEASSLIKEMILEGRLVHTSRFCEEIRDNCTPESTTHPVALVHGVLLHRI